MEMIVLAKITKKYSVKGLIDYSRGVIIEFDKELGEIEHKFEDIFLEFDELDGVSLNLSYDKQIIPQ